MTTKRANWLFLTIILVHVGVVVLLNFAGDRIPIGIVANFFLAQAIVMAPTLLFLFAFERGGRSAGRSEEGLEAYGMPPAVCGVNRPLAAAGFHKVKITTLLMIMLCTFLIMPLVALCNAVSLFFTDNTMASMQGNIVDMPFSVMLFMIGIFGPFCEEFVFRGVFYRSYRADGAGTGIGKAGVQGGGIRAILLSALLFGLMHMNFNQALYAFVMGIFLAVLVEAAGSLWASVFCHMFFNSVEVVLMYVSERILENLSGQSAGEMMPELTTQSLLAALSVYLIIAAVTTPIAVCAVVWIAKNEGRQETMAGLFYGSQKRRTVRQAPPIPQGMPPMPQGMPPMPQGMPPMPQGMPPMPQGMPPMPQGMPLVPQPILQAEEKEPRRYLLSIPLIVGIVLCLGIMSLEFFL